MINIMRYAIRHKETEKFLFIGEESGAWLVGDGEYGILTYKRKEYAAKFLTQLTNMGIWDEGGIVEGEMYSDDFEIVEV